MSASVPRLISTTIAQTKELMGANETALGNVRPENTSAIIALQKSASMQLDIQRMDFYNCVEGYIRSYVDMMRVHYGERAVRTQDTEGKAAETKFDFARLEDCAVNLKIDVGKANYWSELMQIQTLDNLMNKKIIPDAVTYLESLPDGYVKNKQEIIRRVREMQGSGGASGLGAPGGAMPAALANPAGKAGASAAKLPSPEGMQAAPGMNGAQGAQSIGGKMQLSDEEVAGIADMLLKMTDKEARQAIDELSSKIEEESMTKLLKAFER